MPPPPGTPREFFLRVAAHYDRATGLDAMLDRVDWSAASPRQVLYAILGRLPLSAAEATAGPGFDARAQAKDLLQGGEFRARVTRLLLDAFPSKPRLFHIHVPKSAGTHLRAVLGRQFALIPANLGEPGLYAEDEFFARLQAFLTRVREAPAILVSGHARLARYLAQAPDTEAGAPAYRFGDHAFTVLRDPEALMVSHANYVVTRLLDDPGQRRADTRGWLELLGLASLPADMPADGQAALALRVLRDPAITEPDRICGMLGHGTAESVFETLALCDIEISHVEQYRAWLEARWGVVADRRSNASRPILSLDALDRRDRALVRAMTVQDRAVHDRVRHALDATGALSVNGPALWAMPSPRRWLIG